MQFDYRTNDDIFIGHERHQAGLLMYQRLLLLLPDFVRQRFESGGNLQQATANVGWLFFDKVLRLGVGLLVTAWIARYLGPEQYGVWSYAIAFVALFGTFASLGLDGIVVREVVKDAGTRNAVLGSAFVLKLAGGIVALATSLVLIIILKQGDSLTHILVGITGAAFIFQSFDAIDLYFQFRVESKFSVLAKNVAFVVASLFKIALILTGASLIAFAGAGLLEGFLGALFLVIAYNIRGESLRNWRVQAATAVGMLRDSWPLILSGLVIMVYMRIDQIMLGEMIGETAVGLYAAAVRISEIWYFIPVAIAGSMFPRIVELKQRDQALYLRRLQQLYDFLTWVSIAGALTMSLLSGPIVQWLYGTQFQETAGILVVHVWTGVFVSLGVVSSKYLLIENMTKIAFYRSTSGAVVNVLVNLILIPRYGGIGAAVATLLSQSLAAYLFDLANSRTRLMFLMKTRSILFLDAFKLINKTNV